MAKTDRFHIRMEPAEREALERAAAAGSSSLSAFSRGKLVEWLRANRWLPQIDKRPAESKGKGKRRP